MNEGVLGHFPTPPHILPSEHEVLMSAIAMVDMALWVVNFPVHLAVHMLVEF